MPSGAWKIRQRVSEARTMGTLFPYARREEFNRDPMRLGVPIDGPIRKLEPENE
jgi:hypothetical protein